MKIRTLFLFLLLACNVLAHPLTGLLERIDPGSSHRIAFEICQDKSGLDYFELSQRGRKPLIRANSYVNAAVGLNWYLKYYCGIHLSWNCMQAQLPAQLPSVDNPERHETDLTLRYDFNYCTFSYSMAFWDWERWQQEIDWMALHGINMPLAAVGHECVWRNMMLRLGYTEQEIARFIAGPAFLAWWEMNNLEGWGGPLPLSWYEQQEALQRQILRRMQEYGMLPVLPGYSGMCPSFVSDKSKGETPDAGNAASLETEESAQSSIQLWNGFTRPGVLFPGDPRFDEYASLFYEETRKLYGTANYYSIDPFHEAKNLPQDLDIGQAGRKIMSTMKQYGNPRAKWVLQGWSENPRDEMIMAIEPGDLLILDLFSECRPQYGEPSSVWYRPEGYRGHDWLFCLLENFGANVGMHGRMDQLIENFYSARSHYSQHMKGWGLTMEGSETNPVMYELMSELPWRSEPLTKEQWIDQYTRARYALSPLPNTQYPIPNTPYLITNTQYPREANQSSEILQAWQLLARGIYNCPRGNNQQGPSESIFCSRPSLDSYQASSWSKMTPYYDPATTLQAARLMCQKADEYASNDNFRYDLVDVCRQAIADQARVVFHRAVADFKSFDRQRFRQDSQEFLRLLLCQDRLLATRPEFRVGRWIEQARSVGQTPQERDLYEWNARVQITTWGNRYCADEGKLRDYAHKEWNGLLRDFYYPRWQHFFQLMQDELDGRLPMLPVGNSSQLKSAQDNPLLTVDWYAIEEPWTLRHNPYGAQAEGDEIQVAREIINTLQ